jgi:hypothetical protein
MRRQVVQKGTVLYAPRLLARQCERQTAVTPHLCKGRVWSASSDDSQTPAFAGRSRRAAVRIDALPGLGKANSLLSISRSCGFALRRRFSVRIGRRRAGAGSSVPGGLDRRKGARR